MTEISEAAKIRAGELITADWGEPPEWTSTNFQTFASYIQRASDAAKEVLDTVDTSDVERVHVQVVLDPFLLADEPDPLVTALNAALDRVGAFDATEAENLRAELAKRGLMIVGPGLLEACELALNAFETNACIDWDVLAKAIQKARGQ